MMDQTQGLMVSQTAQFTANNARDAAVRGQLENAGRSRNLDKAREAAADFEATFISQMLEHMFETVPTDGLMGGGQGERVFRSMLNQEYGKAIAARGGIGIAENVLGEIIRLQEQAQ